jgi:hypothetical protein
MMLAVEDRCFQPVLLDQLLQQLFPSKLSHSAKVLAVEPQEIEGEENEAVLVASTQVGLKFGEVGALLMDDDDLAVDDRLPFDGEGAGNDREPVDPVMAVAGEGLTIVAVDVELDAIAVVFDFVNPLSITSCD